MVGNVLDPKVFFDIIAVIFGFAAIYYAFLGYSSGGKEAGLKTWVYFFAGMVGMGAFVVLDFLRVFVTGEDILFFEQLFLAVTAILVFFGFRDMYKFFASLE